MATPKGPVRFRFNHDPEQVSVIIEGDSSWVTGLRSEFGLDAVGWLQPLAVTSMGPTEGRRAPSTTGGEGDEFEPAPSEPKKLPGPPPDPSKVPTVRRQIGTLDLKAELMRLELHEPRSPTAAELTEILDKVGPPEIAPEGVSLDAYAESWLRLLLTLAVREFAVTAVPLELIEETIGTELGREGIALEAWLDSLYRIGRLVRVHGGERVGYGPSPTWLDAW